jgi:hypothetical protein
MNQFKTYQLCRPNLFGPWDLGSACRIDVRDDSQVRIQGEATTESHQKYNRGINVAER